MSYNTGVNRLYYKANNFAAGKTVTAYFWSPTLVKSVLQTFTEIELGLYYLDYDFATIGAYAGLFYENGSAVTFGVFRVGTISEVAAADVVTALMASTGVTAGGTFTFGKIMRLHAAWSSGNWRLKAGTTSTFQILDPDDKTTVIAEITPSETTPYKMVNIL
jgi:hypothetical protein